MTAPLNRAPLVQQLSLKKTRKGSFLKLAKRRMKHRPIMMMMVSFLLSIFKDKARTLIVVLVLVALDFQLAG